MSPMFPGGSGFIGGLICLLARPRAEVMRSARRRVRLPQPSGCAARMLRPSDVTSLNT